MKIVLTKDVAGLGKQGSVHEVNNGYGNNFLIKKGLAKLATPDVLKKLEKEQAEATAKEARIRALLSQQKLELEKRTFTIIMKLGPKGQIFGGIKPADIVAAIKTKTKIELEKHQLDIPKDIKQPGKHTIEAKLGKGIIASVTISIEASAV